MFHSNPASLAYDKLSKTGPLLKLYHSECFKNFLQQVLNLDSLYHLEDPVGSAYINICPNGSIINWHFDEVRIIRKAIGHIIFVLYQAVFTVTMMLQKPDAGGVFRKTKDKIRKKGAEDDDLYKKIEEIVTGADVKCLETQIFEPGTLRIFNGSQCLHQVSKVEGEKDRLVVVFCYSNVPGVRNSPQVQELFWGRSATPA